MNHRQRVEANKAKKDPPEVDDEVLRLLECINSGQVEADQYVAHVQAGDLNQGGTDGRDTEN